MLRTIGFKWNWLVQAQFNTDLLEHEAEYLCKKMDGLMPELINIIQ